MKTRFKMIACAITMLGLTTTVSSQEIETVQLDEVSTTNEQLQLEDISTFEQTFVYYTKEIVEGTKSTVSQAVDLIITEGLIITKQYIIFTSISHLIPILIGLLLIFWLSRKIYQNTGRSKISGAVYNDQLEETDEPAFKRPAPLVQVMGRYYKTRMIGITNIIMSLIPLLLGCFLIAINVMDFIKVTFFPKLYLTELALKYLQ